MINIERFKKELPADFIRLIDFFNILEKNLEYPLCSGYIDQKLELDYAVERAENAGFIKSKNVTIYFG